MLVYRNVFILPLISSHPGKFGIFLERPISRNVKKKKNSDCFFFYFSSLQSSLLKYTKNMRQESQIFGNIRNFLILELESSIS